MSFLPITDDAKSVYNDCLVHSLLSHPNLTDFSTDVTSGIFKPPDSISCINTDFSNMMFPCMATQSQKRDY